MIESDTQPVKRSPAGRAKAWVPIGAQDVDGREIHLGDIMDFDGYEWDGRSDGTNVRLTVRLKGGEVDAIGEFGSWCVIVESPGIEVATKPTKPPEVTE